MQHSIFDLDGTVINSKHRYRSLENGDIDLAYWIENNTRENCQKDSLLPAIRTLRNDHRAGCKIIICTARVLSEWDYEFFMTHDLPFSTMLSRPNGCTMGDADLKEIQLRLYAQNQFMSWKRFCKTSNFFEDAQSVLDRMDFIGMPIINANDWNSKLALSHYMG